MAQQQLSGTIVVIIIAVGVQACIIVFVFLKRQVQRFAFRNRRGPYTSVCHGAPKALRRETDRLLAYVQDIKYEPNLQVPAENQANLKRDYRRQIILNYQAFEGELAEFYPHFTRPHDVNVRKHLRNCTQRQPVSGGGLGVNSGPLVGADPSIVHHVCDDYDAARHHYEPIERSRFKAFLERLDVLRGVLRTNKAVAFRGLGGGGYSHHHHQGSGGGGIRTTNSQPGVEGGGSSSSSSGVGPSALGIPQTNEGSISRKRIKSSSASVMASPVSAASGSSPNFVASVVSVVENNSKEQTNVV